MSSVKSDGSFTTTCVVDRSPEQVYEAITDVSRWWTGEVEGRAGQVGDEFTYQFGDLHDSRQRVTELVTDRRMVWEVVDAKRTGRMTADEWIGTSSLTTLITTGEGPTAPPWA